MGKNLLGPGAVVLAVGLFSIHAATAAAQTMEGDHLFLVGSGRMRTSTYITGAQGYDYDRDGKPDSFSGDPKIARGDVITSLQYYYHWSPSWAFGLSGEYVTMSGDSIWAGNVYPFSGGPAYFNATLFAKATSQELLPMVRYTLLTAHRVNPYVLGGVGLNHFSAAVSQSYSIDPYPQSKGDLYQKTSTGLAATLGIGAQATVINHLLAGIEGRWTYCQIDQNAFGQSSWNRFEAFVWIGTKWNAPL